MKIVIVGAGFTGIQLAKILINEKNQVTLIDNNEEVIRHQDNRLDCTIVNADGNSLETLEKVGIAKADALVCVTSSDEVNMITCSLVDAVYPNILKIARVRNYAYYVNTEQAEKKHADFFTGKHRPLYGINFMVHPDVEAAEAIVHAVESGAIGNVINFENTDLQIARISVGEKSSLDGVQLKNIRSISQIKFLVAYVEQDGKTSLASGDTVISANCTLGILVDKNDIPEVLKLCGSEQKELKKVALIGAGRIGTLIAERLISSSKKLSFSGFFAEYSKKHSQKFVIIDNDEILAKNAAEKFPSAKVFNADATDENFLQEEGITNFDLAICATHNHELNMVLASYLESLGVKQSISLVTSAAYSSISQKLGIDVSIPLRDCVIDSIMSHLRGKSVKEIHTVTNGELEILECEISPNSKNSGKMLKEISAPGKYLVLLHKKVSSNSYEIPDGNSQLYSGDRIVLITQADFTKKTLSFFSEE